MSFHIHEWIPCLTIILNKNKYQFLGIIFPLPPYVWGEQWQVLPLSVCFLTTRTVTPLNAPEKLVVIFNTIYSDLKMTQNLNRRSLCVKPVLYNVNYSLQTGIIKLSTSRGPWIKTWITSLHRKYLFILWRNNVSNYEYKLSKHKFIIRHFSSLRSLQIYTHDLIKDPWNYHWSNTYALIM